MRKPAAIIDQVGVQPSSAGSWCRLQLGGLWRHISSSPASCDRTIAAVFVAACRMASRRRVAPIASVPRWRRHVRSTPNTCRDIAKPRTAATGPLADIPATTILERRRRVLTALRESPGYFRWCVIAYQHALPTRLTPPPARRAPRAPWLQDRGGHRACPGDASPAPLRPPRRSWRHAHIPMCKGP